jgi:glycosyltransferase involved in cell wall biosynthesis
MTLVKINVASIYHASSFYGGNEHYLDQLARHYHSHHLITYYAVRHQKNSAPYPIRTFHASWLMGKPLPHLFKTTKLKPAAILHTSGSGLPLHLLAKQAHSHTPTIHTYQAATNPKNPLLKAGSLIEQSLISQAYSAIIATTPTYQKTLQTQFPHQKIFFMPLILSEDFLQKPLSKNAARQKLKLSKEKKYVLFVGQLSPHHYYKGLDVLINTMSTLPPEFHLLIIGEGSQKQKYISLAHSLGISPQLTFLGFKDHHQTHAYYQAADVFVLPSTSDSEGFGMVNLEAMASNTPVITTTAIGSATYFSQHHAAQLVPPQNSPALASSITKTITTPPLSQIKKARRFALNHSTKTIASLTLKIYQETISLWRQNH